MSIVMMMMMRFKVSRIHHDCLIYYEDEMTGGIESNQQGQFEGGKRKQGKA